MNNKYDVVIIGGGHNGLTTATKLAKKRKRVLLLEKREILGGIAAGEEFHPNYKSVGLLHDTSNIRIKIVQSLRLTGYGLKLSSERPRTTLLGNNDESITLSHDVVKSSNEIAKFSRKDAEAYINYHHFIDRIRPFIDGLMNEFPPDLMKLGTKDIWSLVKKAIGLKRLGKKTMLEFMKVAPMSVADFLNERFETHFIKAGIAAPAIYHSFTGPWSSYTTLNLLLWECASTNTIVGGPQALVSALELAARSSGVDVLTDSPVEKILLGDDSKVIGVRLANGKTVSAPIVASSCTPKVTFIDFLEPNQIEYSLEHGVQNYRSRGTAVKVNLALDKALVLNGESNIEFARTGNSFDEMEQAFDFVKYRQFSKEPILDIHIPTISIPGLVPDGHCVVSILAHFAPFELKGGWSDHQKEIFGNNVIRTLEQYAPDLSKSIVCIEVLTPQNLEKRYSLTGGNIYHGEHAVDQILTRPIPSCMRYSTPIEGLYLCGSGSHPGGGITCSPGDMASEAILRNL